MNCQKVEVSVEKIHEELTKTTAMMYDAMKMTDAINKRLIAAFVIFSLCASLIVVTYIVCNKSEMVITQEYEDGGLKITNGGSQK